MIYKDFILPDPPGYYMLVEIITDYVTNSKGLSFDHVKNEAVTAGGIVIPKEVVMDQSLHCNIATILKQGDGCYQKWFQQQTGSQSPWCKEGDTVVLRADSGYVVPHFGQDFAKGRFQYITDQAICGTYNEEELKILKARSK